MTKRILVCGGRKFDKRGLLRDTLDGLLREHGEVEIIHGGARGADYLASQWAKDRGQKIRAFPAHWQAIGSPGACVKIRPNGQRYDANAGPKRNQQMLEEGEPEIVVAFEGGNGTQDMIDRTLVAIERGAQIQLRRIG